MKTAIELIADERRRQVEQKGWTAEHDDHHRDGELAMAAVCYAATEPVYIERGFRGLGYINFCDPWPLASDKRPRCRGTSELLGIEDIDAQVRIRQLVKAAALLAAEIERLQRLGSAK